MKDHDGGYSDSSDNEHPPIVTVGPKDGAPNSQAATHGSSNNPQPSQEQLDRDLVKWTKGLANWTKALAIFTGILVIAAGLQFWVMRDQLREMTATRESGDKATASQLAVMQTQASALERQSDEMKEAAAQTERAIAATNRLAKEAARSADESHRLADVAARSADESHRLADAAEAANSETKQLSNAAVQANQINRRSLTQVQRAFVEPEGVNYKPTIIDFGKNMMFNTTVEIENSGNTPTSGLTVRMRCETSYHAVDDPYTLPSDKSSKDGIYGRPFKYALGPRETKDVGQCIVGPDTKINEATDISIQFHYIFGLIEYKDTLDPDTVHLSEFCFSLVYDTEPISIWKTLPERDASYWKGRTITCSTHNCADNDCNKDDMEQAVNDLLPTSAKRR